MVIRNNVLFKVSSFKSDLENIKKTLSEKQLNAFNQFSSLCKKEIGNLTQYEYYPYRVADANYIKLSLIGTKKPLTITFVLSGYTEWPRHPSFQLREYIYVVDCVDCYWLIKLLIKALSTNYVDNPVDNKENKS